MKKAIIPALLTPFKNRKIDEEALRALVEYSIRKGVSGFYVCGSTGEAFMLRADDRKHIVEIVADQVKKTRRHHRTDRFHRDRSGRRFGQTRPWGGRSERPFVHPSLLLQIHRRGDSPLLSGFGRGTGNADDSLQFPRLSGVTLTPDFISKLIEEKAIAGLKFTSENFYDLEKIKLSYPDLTVYNGLDEMYISGLAMGADGAIGSTFNFMADKFIRISDFFEEGRIEEARRLQSEANQVIEALFGVRCFMAAQKYMLDLIGIPFGDPQRPFMPLNDEEKSFLKKRCESLLAR